MRPTPSPVGSPDTSTRPASMASSASSDSLRPPGPKILMPLSGIALCDAEMTMPRSAPRSAVRNATAGVGRTPSCSTSTPAEASPAATAASSISPDARGSRPSTANGRSPSRGVPAVPAASGSAPAPPPPTWSSCVAARRAEAASPPARARSIDSRHGADVRIRAAEVARLSARAGVRSAFASPRTPSVPKSLGISASSTAEPSGPS